MKKLALLLVLIVCVVSVVCIFCCGSGAESAAEDAFVAEYVDYNFEDFYEVSYIHNFGLLEKFMKNSEKYEELTDNCRDARDNVKSAITTSKSMQDLLEAADCDFDIEYEVRYCQEYGKTSAYYDVIMSEFEYADTFIEDAVSKVAVVGIVGELYATDLQDNETVSSIYVTYYCYKIDGDWYVDAVDTANGGVGIAEGLGILGDLY